MGAQRKTSGQALEDTEELSRQPLQAVLLADSFTTKFRPITLERPKVLLPLVNTPMIDYTLAWLESAGVEEVFVFCCAHSKQVIDYLENSEWMNQQRFSINTIESHNSISAGDALRLIYERNVIHGDFVLISGDTVSNMSLSQVLKEHKERRKKDSNAIMTMVIKRSKPSPVTRQTRLGSDELFMAIDPSTKQLLYFEDRLDCSKGTISLDKTFLVDNPCVSVHNDKQDCYIDVCSPEVLSLFTDNFDYQHLRRHFVKGLLVDDIMGYKIYTYEIHSSYAAHVDNFRSYDTISKDIMQRWTYPYVPDVKFCGTCASKHERMGIYRSADTEVSRSAQVGPFAVVGYGTKIGSNARISNSVIGEGCSIGSDVLIEGSYIWNNVTIEDGCKLRHAIVCDGVVIKLGAVLEPGVILSFKEEVYMEQPPGFVAQGESGRVCRLRKSLYGLKQSPRAWFGKFSEAIEQFGISSLKFFIHSQFHTKDLGMLKYFLGVEVSRCKKGIFLSQRKYVLDLLTETGKLGAKPCSAPMTLNMQLTRDGELFRDPEKYRRLVGKLNYLTVTRPDIAYSVSVVSQFMSSPTVHHWAALDQILCYLKGPPGRGIMYTNHGHTHIECFSDADWAGSKMDRRSTTGYCVFVGGNLVSWKSKKQNIMSRSSAESEYRAMAQSVFEIMWIYQLLTETGLKTSVPAKLWCDNQAALHIASNPVFHEQTKHIEIDCHFVR